MPMYICSITSDAYAHTTISDVYAHTTILDVHAYTHCYIAIDITVSDANI